MALTFRLRNPDGDIVGDPIPYKKLFVQIGGHDLMLALHQDAYGHWTVSCPVTGARVLIVSGQYRGAVTSSQGMELSECKRAAADQVLALAKRVGETKFVATISKAREKYAQEAQA